MIEYQIVEAHGQHADAIADLMGLTPEAREVLGCLSVASPYSRVATADDCPVGMWGILPPNEVWAALPPIARQRKFPLLRIAIEELRAALLDHRELVAHAAASDVASRRFMEFFGFSLGERHDGVFLAVLRRAPQPSVSRRHPFVVYSSARSRSAWMAKFLSFGEWTCHHEASECMRDIEDVRALFRRPWTGTVETAAVFGRPLLRHICPSLTEIVIRRPPSEVLASHLRLGVPYDVPMLSRIIDRADRTLAKIAEDPAVLSVDYADLSREDTCAAIFERCLSTPLPSSWWRQLKDQNIQRDIPAMVAYRLGNRGSIDAFKRACRGELARLARNGTFAKAA